MLNKQYLFLNTGYHRVTLTECSVENHLDSYFSSGMCVCVCVHVCTCAMCIVIAPLV